MTAASVLLDFLKRTIFAVIIVTLLLFCAGPAQQIILPAISAAGNLREIKSQIDRVGNNVEQEVSAANLRLEKLRGLTLTQIADRLRVIDAELKKLDKEPNLQSNSYLDIARFFVEGNLEKSLKNELRKAVLHEENRLLKDLENYTRLLSDRKSQQAQLNAIHIKWRDAKQAEISAEKKYRELDKQALCGVPFIPCSKVKDQALDEWRKASEKAWGTYDDWKVLNSVLNGSKNIGTAPALQINSAIIRSSLDDMARQLARVESWGISTADPALGALQTACQIVAAALTVGLVLKTVFYFLLAPLAQRRPAMVVRQGSRMLSVKEYPLSSISLPISLSPSEELVVIGSHLQSLTDGHETSTKWLFSTTHPFSSFLSGLWMMTRVQAGSPCTAVLSATTDPLEELNSYRLEAGEGLVILPKHLLGVVHPRGANVLMRSHWKFDIHAWLDRMASQIQAARPLQ